ncbi:deleted in malignant brain tumors 1 protein [Clinocottus analis]|uniref:deleted in malignant brain tumors 1 protein n=1 Tax=Clinocottus analis TaxID=304258 RepID=UPI0035C23B97
MGIIQQRNLCYLAIDGQVRVVGPGATHCSGRVEISYNGVWGTVCDDEWDLKDADVVCRHLGCGTALRDPLPAQFGAGTGQIWLDDVHCSGNESSLTECQHRGFGTHNCEHNEDAGVICSGEKTFGGIVVGPGATHCSGRVEISYNGVWGTVCDDEWDLEDADVVCRHLDCGTALRDPLPAQFGAGTGQIWLDDVHCSGNESSLTECQHRGFGTHNCGHNEDAGVICSDGQIRVVGPGATHCSGRVEISYNGVWGTVCNDEWDLEDADVVCRHLDCGTALRDPLPAQFGAGTGQIWLDDVHCSGNESSLTECQHRGFGTHNCGHNEDAGVICSDGQIRVVGPGATHCSGRVEISYNGVWGTVCDDEWDLKDADVVCRHLDCGTALRDPLPAQFGAGTGPQVRVVGPGATHCSGRVEISYNGVWGTVCDDEWDLEDADVVCRHLGCGTALRDPLPAQFGAGTGQIWLDDVHCSGNESSLTECQHRGFGTHNCGHNEDAGVICSGPQIRVVGPGATHCSGRVEISYKGVWGTVCDDEWDLEDADVVCRHLDCGTALRDPLPAQFGAGTGQIWLDDVHCSGNESSLTECQHRGFGTHNCEHNEDAGVICSVIVGLLLRLLVLLVLVVLVVVCLVCKRKRRAEQPVALDQNQLTVRLSNDYNTSEDACEDPANVYENINPANSKKKLKEEAGRAEEEESDVDKDPERWTGLGPVPIPVDPQGGGSM